MENEKQTSLTSKYLNAKTSLSEEEVLFSNSQDTDTGIDNWSKYVRHTRKSAPTDLNSNLWKRSSLSKNAKTRIIIPLVTMAASVLLFFMVRHFDKPFNGPSYQEKKMLLEEALAMFDETEQNTTENKIIYNDDLIVIYLSSN